MNKQIALLTISVACIGAAASVKAFTVIAHTIPEDTTLYGVLSVFAAAPFLISTFWAIDAATTTPRRTPILRTILLRLALIVVGIPAALLVILVSVMCEEPADFPSWISAFRNSWKAAR